MAKVLTAAASITCAHQGKVQFTVSQQTFTAGGQPVLVSGDIEGKPIAGCTQTSASTKPCTTALALVAGMATKLKAGNKPVLLDTATGPTDGSPPGVWSVQSAGQSKLDAT
jgi:hypothetical protein